MNIEFEMHSESKALEVPCLEHFLENNQNIEKTRMASNFDLFEIEKNEIDFLIQNRNFETSLSLGSMDIVFCNKKVISRHNL